MNSCLLELAYRSGRLIWESSFGLPEPHVPFFSVFFHSFKYEVGLDKYVEGSEGVLDLVFFNVTGNKPRGIVIWSVEYFSPYYSFPLIPVKGGLPPFSIILFDFCGRKTLR